MNKHLFSLLCIGLLAGAPACKRDKKEATEQQEQEDLNTMIELDNTVVFEEEEETSGHKKKTIKY